MEDLCGTAEPLNNRGSYLYQWCTLNWASVSVNIKRVFTALESDQAHAHIILDPSSASQQH